MSRHYTDEELLAFARELASYPKPALPPDARRELRRSLLTRELPVQRRRFFTRLAPGLAAALAVLVLVAGSGAAAASSLPGDPAYALKRVVEDVELMFAQGEVARLHLLVAQSDRRLGELETAVSHRPSVLPAATSEYLAAVTSLSRSVSSLGGEPLSPERDAALAIATTASDRHEQVLASLLDRVPDTAKPGIQRAIEAQRGVPGKSPIQPGRTPPHPSPPRR